MDLIYGIKDKPRFGKVVLFALQQLLAIMAATIAVPAIIGHGLTASAALFGAGVGTIVYLLFTKSSSPVFLGSSFAFIGSMFSAFAGAATLGLSEQAGYWGLIIGALMAGLVYVIIAIIVKFCGVEWINKLMPPVIIGPTVAIIGLSLSGNAIGDLMKSSVEGGSTYVALICGLFTLAITMLFSTYGKKVGRLIPFILGILAGYLLATLFAIIGNLIDNPALIVINYGAVKALDFSKFSGYISLPNFTFLLGGTEGLKAVSGKYLLTLFSAYVPVAFVVFAEHLADHKNLSAIVGKDLLKEPGLTRTLLGDGVGTIVSTAFGGCPNTTYGESIGCVAITRNASTISIWGCAIICIIFSMISPLVAFLETIPNCVMGGVCVALYGFIAVSGFKMFQSVDLNKNKNLFVASVIFITGVGGMVVSFGAVEIRTVACALILGILTNLMLSKEDA
ncbi:uracil permease [Treponema bryantii]|uniref:Uracil permease n=1 Tax=Treponema bryantii TaxID=163 RepID=A0A1H9JJR9_9SPIR|nr:solute carrier family 23 protein [Treponema bryantii]SEQ87086.1 uracil permease [Treponema bryantii]